MPFLEIIAALIALVVLHELGHFLAARAVGIRATKFYIFFPPALLKRTIGDVEYGIGAIPAGGFVKLPGMFEPDPGEVAERMRVELDEVQPHIRDSDVRLQLDAARRAIAHADGADGLVAPLTELRSALLDVQEELAGGAQEARTAVRATTGRIDNLLDDLHPRAYWRAALWRRMTVIFAGPLTNVLIAFVVLVGFYGAWVPRYDITKPFHLSAVEANGPAKLAGVSTKDEIVGWNGPVVGQDVDRLNQRIADGRGKPVTLTWRDRHGTVTSRTIFPAHINGEDAPRIGVALPHSADVQVRVAGRTGVAWPRAAHFALLEMRDITWGSVSSIPRVFFDKQKRKELSSVVGIVQVADDVDQAGMLVRYVAFISMALAVMNLLPLLPLDGGHLLFGLLEALRRRPMPRAAFERYSMIGMAFVLLLFFIGLDNDITRARG
jgi:regulator of sigma E protease